MEKYEEWKTISKEISEELKTKKNYLDSAYEFERLGFKRKKDLFCEFKNLHKPEELSKMLMRSDLKVEKENKQETELQRRIRKYYNKFIDVLIKKYGPEIEQEREKHKELMKEVGEKDISALKEYFGREMATKLYKKINKDCDKWKDNKDAFTRKICKMMNYKYSVENVKLFLKKFYNAEDAEKCLSYLEQEVSGKEEHKE